jgi:hypothetical protein
MAILHQSYDPSLFVGRQAELAMLLERLLDEEADAKRHRCIVIEGPGQRGKTWLLARLSDELLQHPTRPIVLYLTSRELAQDAPDREELFKRFLVRPWDAAQQIVRNIPELQDKAPALSVVSSGQFAEFVLERIIEIFITPLTTIPGKIYFIVIIDGIEEIPSDILVEFENLFIAPLFRNHNVRIVAARRMSEEKPFKRFIVSRQIRFEPLEGFDKAPALNNTVPLFAKEQVERLIDNLRVRSKQISFTFDHFRQQTRHYVWSNPGANALLVQCAIQHGGQLTYQCLDSCLQQLCASAGAGKALDEQDMGRLFALVRVFPNLHQGQDLASIGKELGMDDRDRNTFIGRLIERGIARQPSYRLIVPPEVTTLIRELQERTP